MAAPHYPITAVAPTVAAVLGLRAPREAEAPPLPRVGADLAGVSAVAVLAADAVGLTVWQRWQEEMPFLTALHARRHLVLHAVAPPITPVNFASLVTGASLDGHGVRERTMRLRADSLFDIVAEAGAATAGVGQLNYTGGEFLACHSSLNGRTAVAGDDAVAEMVLRLARDYRPRFLIAQLGEPDTMFHKVGLSSPEVAPVLRETDARLRRMTEELAAQGFGVILLADHGQHEVPAEDEPGRFRGQHDGSVRDDFLIPCTWVA